MPFTSNIVLNTAKGAKVSVFSKFLATTLISLSFSFCCANAYEPVNKDNLLKEVKKVGEQFVDEQGKVYKDVITKYDTIQVIKYQDIVAEKLVEPHERIDGVYYIAIKVPVEVPRYYAYLYPQTVNQVDEKTAADDNQNVFLASSEANKNNLVDAVNKTNEAKTSPEANKPNLVSEANETKSANAEKSAKAEKPANTASKVDETKTREANKPNLVSEAKVADNKSFGEAKIPRETNKNNLVDAVNKNTPREANNKSYALTKETKPLSEAIKLALNENKEAQAADPRALNETKTKPVNKVKEVKPANAVNKVSETKVANNKSNLVSEVSKVNEVPGENLTPAEIRALEKAKKAVLEADKQIEKTANTVKSVEKTTPVDAVNKNTSSEANKPNLVSKANETKSANAVNKTGEAKASEPKLDMITLSEDSDFKPHNIVNTANTVLKPLEKEVKETPAVNKAKKQKTRTFKDFFKFEQKMSPNDTASLPAVYNKDVNAIEQTKEAANKTVKQTSGEAEKETKQTPEQSVSNKPQQEQTVKQTSGEAEKETKQPEQPASLNKPSNEAEKETKDPEQQKEETKPKNLIVPLKEETPVLNNVKTENKKTSEQISVEANNKSNLVDAVNKNIPREANKTQIKTVDEPIVVQNETAVTKPVSAEALKPSQNNAKAPSKVKTAFSNFNSKVKKSYSNVKNNIQNKFQKKQPEKAAPKPQEEKIKTEIKPDTKNVSSRTMQTIEHFDTRHVQKSFEIGQ